MEHPFLSTADLAELTLDEIQTKISELTNKLSVSYQTNNQTLINQISMVLESYNSARAHKLNDMFPKDKGDGHSDKINIS
jgi:hypothetical protein